jgi:hypothetical protein
VPECARKEWKLRTSPRHQLTPRTRGIAGLSTGLEGFRSATENRGVPGSSPGLAIAESRMLRDFSFSGGCRRARNRRPDLGLMWAWAQKNAPHAPGPRADNPHRYWVSGRTPAEAPTIAVVVSLERSVVARAPCPRERSHEGGSSASREASEMLGGGGQQDPFAGLAAHAVEHLRVNWSEDLHGGRRASRRRLARRVHR